MNESEGELILRDEESLKNANTEFQANSNFRVRHILNIIEECSAMRTKKIYY